MLSEGFAATDLGVRGSDYRLLAALADAGEASQAELASRAVLDRSDVAVAIAELEQKGLVERKPDPANRRRNIVSLTKDGSRALAELDSVLDGIQDRVLAPLSPAERKKLVELLRKLAAGSPPPA
jgi:DNA-binding MarR family transcriptional regulator